jgi:hypothetical protein
MRDDVTPVSKPGQKGQDIPLDEGGRRETNPAAPGTSKMKRLTMSDINAYLDGALSEEDRVQVEHALRTDHEAAALLQQYRQQVQELHRIYDGVLSEPVPQRMLDALRRRSGGAS